MGSAVAVTGLEKKNVNKCRIGHAVKRVNTSHQHDISSCFAVLLSSFGKKKNTASVFISSSSKSSVFLFLFPTSFCARGSCSTFGCAVFVPPPLLFLFFFFPSWAPE